MPLPIHVVGFELDAYRRIYTVEDQWYSPDALYFKVRADGKTYILRYNERENE